MELRQAVKLINNNSLQGGDKSVWADLGCGGGLFTYALANLLPRESVIYAIDKSKTALQKHSNPTNVDIIQRQYDFVNDEMDLPPLDGILMANSFHYVRDKAIFIRKLEGYLKPEAILLFVEYDTDKPNPWVPYPTSFKTLQSLFKTAGYSSIIKLSEQPSLFGTGNMYAAFIGK